MWRKRQRALDMRHNAQVVPAVISDADLQQDELPRFNALSSLSQLSIGYSGLIVAWDLLPDDLEMI